MSGKQSNFHGGFEKEIYENELFSKKYETKDTAPAKTTNKIFFNDKRSYHQVTIKIIIFMFDIRIFSA